MGIMIELCIFTVTGRDFQQDMSRADLILFVLNLERPLN